MELLEGTAIPSYNRFSKNNMYCEHPFGIGPESGKGKNRII
jgi:hypothetical protein